MKRPLHALKRRRWEELRRTGNPVEFQLAGESLRMLPEGQIAELLYTSRFEHEDIRLVSALLRRGMNVVDVGANIGLYALLASRRVAPGGRVWAFEPSSDTSALLRRNLELNAVESVEVVQAALADTPGGSLVLRREPGYRDGDRYLSANGAAADAPVEGDSGDVERVEVTSLDAWREANPEAERIHFLKMDVEGGELAVLRGAVETLESNRNLVILLECTAEGCRRAGHTQDDVFRFLREKEFSLRAWNPRARRWEDGDERLKTAGNIWAGRSSAVIKPWD